MRNIKNTIFLTIFLKYEVHNDFIQNKLVLERVSKRETP